MGESSRNQSFNIDTLKNIDKKYAELWERVKNPQRSPQRLFNHKAVEFKLRPSVIDRVLQNNELPTSTPMIINRKLLFTPEDSVCVSPISKEMSPKNLEETSVIQANSNKSSGGKDKTAQDSDIITISSCSEVPEGKSRVSEKQEKSSVRSLRSQSSASAKNKLESIVVRLTQDSVDKTVQISRKSLDQCSKLARNIYTQTSVKHQTQKGDSLYREGSVSASPMMSSEMNDIVSMIDDGMFPYNNMILTKYSEHEKERKEAARNALPWRPPSRLQSLPSFTSFTERLPEDEETLDETFRPTKPPRKKVFTNKKKLPVGRRKSRLRKPSDTSKQNGDSTTIFGNEMPMVAEVSRKHMRSAMKNLEGAAHESSLLERSKECKNLEDKSYGKRSSKKKRHIEETKVTLEENKRHEDLKNKRLSKSGKRTLNKKEYLEKATGVSFLEEKIYDDLRLAAKLNTKPQKIKELVEQATEMTFLSENERDEGLKNEKLLKSDKKITITKKKEYIDKATGVSFLEEEIHENVEDQMLPSKFVTRAQKEKESVTEATEVIFLKEIKKHEDLENERLSKSDKRTLNKKINFEKTTGVSLLEQNKQHDDLENERSKSDKKTSKKKERVEKAIKVSLLEENKQHEGLEDESLSKSGKITFKKKAYVEKQHEDVDNETLSSYGKRTLTSIENFENVTGISLQEKIHENLEDQKLSPRPGKAHKKKHFVVQGTSTMKANTRFEEENADVHAEIISREAVEAQENVVKEGEVERAEMNNDEALPRRNRGKSENIENVNFADEVCQEQIITNNEEFSVKNRSMQRISTTSNEILSKKVKMKTVIKGTECEDENAMKVDFQKDKKNKRITSTRKRPVKSKPEPKEVTSVSSEDTSGGANVRRSTRDRKAPVPRSLVYYNFSLEEAPSFLSRFTTSTLLRGSTASLTSRFCSCNELPSFSPIAEETEKIPEVESEPQSATSQREKSVISGRVSAKRKTGRQKKEELSDGLRRSVRLEAMHTNFRIGGKEKIIEWCCTRPKYQPFEEIPGVSMALTVGISEYGNSCGYLKIDPSRTKPKTVTNEHSMNFFVIKGQAEVGVENKCLRITVPASFVVPKGSEYYIKNASNKKPLVLSFTRTMPPNDN